MPQDKSYNKSDRQVFEIKVKSDATRVNKSKKNAKPFMNSTTMLYKRPLWNKGELDLMDSAAATAARNKKKGKK